MHVKYIQNMYTHFMLFVHVKCIFIWICILHIKNLYTKCIYNYDKINFKNEFPNGFCYEKVVCSKQGFTPDILALQGGGGAFLDMCDTFPSKSMNVYPNLHPTPV